MGSAEYGSVAIRLPEGVTRELLAHDAKYTVVRINQKKGVESPSHKHPHAQVDYILSGRCVMDINGRHVELKAGDSVSIAPDEPHSFLPSEDDIEFLEFFVPGREDIFKAEAK
jgi:quercetin dioxygenase-like cupin family protein